MEKFSQYLASGELIKIEQVSDGDRLAFVTLRSWGADPGLVTHPWITHIYYPDNDTFRTSVYHCKYNDAVADYEERIKKFKAIM